MNKLWVVGVIVLFIVMSIVPSSGNVVVIDDNTPPVSTHILDPRYPDGLNGWYVSDVTVILIANDDMSGVKEIRYHVNGIPGTIPGDHGTFVITEDEIDLPVEYWAIDNAGNEEAHHFFTIDMDQTKPEIDLRFDIFQKEGQWYVRFTCNATDAMSDMNRVEFYMNNVLQKIVFGSRPTYEWEFEIDFDIDYSVSGLICNRQITEEKVSFFAIYVKFREFVSLCSPSLSELRTTIAVGYDNAGHFDYDDVKGYVPPPPEPPIKFTHFTFANNYKGYIGRFYINAEFNDYPLKILWR